MGHPFKYRADIDGLRAVSILLVVSFHAHPWLLPGGFIGVDVFFVISGFLITRLLLDEQAATGHISIPNFYARRARRIFPALILVLAVSYLAGWLILMPDQFRLLGQNIVAGALFASNLFQLGQTGYFAPLAAESPLLHLWSLGIEEQFYIFWPWVLVLLGSSPRRRGHWLLLLAACSFAANLVAVFSYKDWAFYSPATRAWELLAGCAVADLRLERRGGDVLSALGLLAIIGAALFVDRSMAFPGAYALLPVVGACLIIASPSSMLNRLLLANRTMVGIGLISYPLYLWHWPLLSYLGIVRNGVPNFLEIWAAVILAVALSFITFRYVEMPIRRSSAVALRLAVSLACVALLGAATVVGNGFENRFPPEIRQMARIKTEEGAGFLDHCFTGAPHASLDETCIEPGDKPLLFLWGDSTAGALYPGLKSAERSHAFRLARFSVAGCAPILDASGNASCDNRNTLIFRYVQQSHPKIVLLHAMWDSYNLRGLEETVSRLKALDAAHIIILGPVPVWKRTLPTSIVNIYRVSRELPMRIKGGYSGPEVDVKLKTISQAQNIDFISAWNRLCNNDGCLTFVDGQNVITTDIVHLSEAGSRFLIEAVSDQLFSSTNSPTLEEFPPSRFKTPERE